jgi:hypothetical protein
MVRVWPVPVNVAVHVQIQKTLHGLYGKFTWHDIFCSQPVYDDYLSI